MVEWILCGTFKKESMNRELTDEELLVASDEEWAMYKQFTEGLPSMAGKNNDGKDKFGEYIPYHSGPHIIRHIRKTIEIVKPITILEIGFNMGHSASMWLNVSNADLISIDISRKDETIEGARLLKDKYKDRFRFYFREDFDQKVPYLKAQWGSIADLIFIDGGHEEPEVTADIELAKDLKIQYLLFDDYYPRFGPGTQPAIAKFPLELIIDMNNLRLYKWKL